MARTPLMHLLQRAARQCAAASADRPLGRRAMLRGAGAAAAVALLPATGLAATARIAVVGAGLAGLTAAYRLQQAGYRPDVFEGEHAAGRPLLHRARRVRRWADRRAWRRVHRHRAQGNPRPGPRTRPDAGRRARSHAAAHRPALSVRRQAVHAGRCDARLGADLQAGAATIDSVGDYDYRKANAAARRFDAMTISDWVAAYVPGGRTGQLGLLLENAFAEENAADAGQQSALNLISALAVDPSRPFQPVLY